jgi:hypothetical protein
VPTTVDITRYSPPDKEAGSATVGVRILANDNLAAGRTPDTVTPEVAGSSPVAPVGKGPAIARLSHVWAVVVGRTRQTCGSDMEAAGGPCGGRPECAGTLGCATQPKISQDVPRGAAADH